MPDKKISSAKCHLCGERIPFTYGNPNELIQHMLKCNGEGTSQQFNPSSCPDKPCVKIVDCPNKPAKCTTCGGKKVTPEKTATIYDAPEDAPIKCTICVAPKPKEVPSKKIGKTPKSKTPYKASPKTSKTKTNEQPKKTNKKKSTPKIQKKQDIATPYKVSPKTSKTKTNKQPKKTNKKKSTPKIQEKQDIACGCSNIVQNADECCEAQDFAKPRRCTQSQTASYTECKKSSTSNTPSQTCNKTVCFANDVSESENNSVANYSPCNLMKRKGTKEMYKTTLETWTAGCGTIVCGRCNRKVVPLIRKQKNKIAFTSVGASLLLTCWPFCFLIPMMHNYSVDLYCPCCKYKLGVYNSSTATYYNCPKCHTKFTRMSLPQPPLYTQNCAPFPPERAVTILQIPQYASYPSVFDPPPSYNSTMRMALPIIATNARDNLPQVHGQTNQQRVHILMARFNRSICQPSAPFYYHPPPPPTYSESEFGFVGRRNRHPSLLNFECSPSRFTRDPQLTTCRNCGYVSLTVTENHYTRHAHAACIALCVLGCFLCSWLPYLVKSCKETRHFCAYCNRLVGVYNPWDMRWTISEQELMMSVGQRDHSIRLC